MTTLEELKAQIRALIAQLEEATGESFFPKKISDENDRIERYLSDFTQREGSLLTIASLFTIFPFIRDDGATKYFLVWVIPILIFSVVMYIFSTKRINFVSDSSTLQDEKISNSLLKKKYFSSLCFHRLTDASAISYFFSFISNYYHYYFAGLPNDHAPVLLLVASLLVGFLRYRLVNKIDVDKDNNKTITLGNVYAVGSAPPEI